MARHLFCTSRVFTIVVIPLLTACTQVFTVSVPKDVWQFLYNAEMYRDRSQGAIKELERMRARLKPEFSLPDAYTQSRLSYAEARGHWNALIDNLETMIIANQQIADWTTISEDAKQAKDASEGFFNKFPAAEVALNPKDTSAYVSGPPIFNVAANLPDWASGLVPKWQDVVDLWKEINRMRKEQRDEVIAELDKRKWPSYECVVEPKLPECLLPAKPAPGKSPTTPGNDKGTGK